MTAHQCQNMSYSYSLWPFGWRQE